MTAIAYAIQILAMIPSLIGTGQKLVQFVAEAEAKLKTFRDEGRDPTQAEWDELNVRIAALRTDLHAP